MRLALFDTNVVVSAAINPNDAPAKLIVEWVLQGQIQIVTSPYLIWEYRQVFRRPKFARYGFPPIWLEFLICESLQLPEPPTWPHKSPDPKDSPLLALAQVSGAWLITGNLIHFPEHCRQGIAVLSPADYLALLDK